MAAAELYNCPNGRYTIGYYANYVEANAAMEEWTNASGIYGWGSSINTSSDRICEVYCWYNYPVFIFPYVHNQGTYAATAYVADTSEISGKNRGGRACPVMVGNPVNAATGNKYEPVTDLTVSTPAYPLSSEGTITAPSFSTTNSVIDRQIRNVIKPFDCTIFQ